MLPRKETLCLLVTNLYIIGMYSIYRLLIPVVGWEYLDKSWQEHFSSVWQLCLLVSFSFQWTERLPMIDLKWCYLGMVIGYLVFGGMSCIKWLQFSLSTAAQVLRRDHRPLIVYLVGLCLAATSMGYHVWYACKRPGKLIGYMFEALFWTSMLLGIGYAMANPDPDGNIYLHHWPLFWIAATLCPFPTTVSQFSAGVYFGIVIQAYAAYNGNVIYE